MRDEGYLQDDENSNVAGQPTFDEICSRAMALPPKERPAAKDRVLDRLASDRELTSTAFAVAITLLIDLMWKEGCVDRLGFNDIVLRTGKSRSSVMRAVDLLEESGHVLVDRCKRSPKTNEINRYTFLHFFS